VGVSVPAVHGPVVSVEGMGEHQTAGRQDRSRYSTDRVAQTEVVVHQQLLSTDIVYGVDAIDPAAGSGDGAGQA